MAKSFVSNSARFNSGAINVKSCDLGRSESQRGDAEVAEIRRGCCRHSSAMLCGLRVSALKKIKMNLLKILILLCCVTVSQAQQSSTVAFENAITRALAGSTGARHVTVRITNKQDKPSEILRLAIKLEGVEVGQLVADNMMVVTENPVIDVTKLRKENRLEFVSHGKMKVSILASVKSLHDYLQKKAQQFNKKNVNISLKFTPPYVECFYDVPKDEVAPESVDMLKKFIPGDKIEGYAVFRIDAKENGLYASSSKVITNHFLLPNALLQLFESKFNPFDQIAVLKPFDYNINSLTVQSKYLYLTN
jgi:hypothetical protein